MKQNERHEINMKLLRSWPSLLLVEGHKNARSHLPA